MDKHTEELLTFLLSLGLTSEQALSLITLKIEYHRTHYGGKWWIHKGEEWLRNS